MDSDGEFGHGGVSSEDDNENHHDHHEEFSSDDQNENVQFHQPQQKQSNNNNNTNTNNSSNGDYPGKTSIEANKQLMLMFSSMANEHELNHPFKLVLVIKKCLTDVDILCGLYIVIVCFIGYGYVGSLHMLIEGLLLFVLICSLTFVNSWREFLEHSELVRLLRARMELVLELPTLAQTQTTDHPPSATFVRTKRDGIWRPLPANLLVQGDLIEIDSDDDLPGKCVPVNTNQSEKQETKQSFNNNQQNRNNNNRNNKANNMNNLNTRDLSVINSHSYPVVHPSLTSSPFHSFSTPHINNSNSHPALRGYSSNSNIHHLQHSHSQSNRSYPRQLTSPPQTHSNHHNNHATSPSLSVIAPPPPMHPPSPPFPPPPSSSSALNDQLSEPLVSNSEDDETRDQFRSPVHPMQKSRGFQSVSSLSSFTSQKSPQASSQQPSLSALASSSVRQFIIVEPPLKHQLEFILKPPAENRRERPPKPIAVARAEKTKRIIRWIVLICWLIYIILTIIRLGINGGFPSPSDYQSGADKQWYVALFYYSGLILLPVCFLPVPIYLFLLDAFGNAHLLVLQEAVQARTEQGYGPSSLLSAEGQQREQRRRERERRMAGGHRGKIRSEESVSSKSSNSSDSSSDSGDSFQGGRADIDDSNTFAFIDSLTLASSSIIRHTRDILTGHDLYITRVVNPLLVLGNITVFCCLDNEGILSENEPSPDHILVFDSESKPVIIDLINDPNSENGIVMEGDWNSHLSALKPIGLNCLLNHPCNLSSQQLCAYEFSATDNNGGEGHTNNHSDQSQSHAMNQSHDSSGCLCPLGREIGFDVSWVRQHFYIAKILYHFTLIDASNSKVKPRRRGRGSAKLPPKSSLLLNSQSETINNNSEGNNSQLAAINQQKIRSVTSMAVQDRLMPDSFHWLSRGDPLLLFSSCDSYWDGSEIKQIDSNVHSHFFNILQQWQHQDLQCIAFAYTPIHPAFYSQILDPTTQVEYLIQQVEAKEFKKKLQSPPVNNNTEKISNNLIKETNQIMTEIDNTTINGENLHESALPLSSAHLFDSDVNVKNVDVVIPIDPDIEVELDEQTDLVAEEDRRVRWETDADNEDSTQSSSGISNAETNNTNNANNNNNSKHSSTSGPAILSSVKPVRILSIPTLNSSPSNTNNIHNQATTPSSANSRAAQMAGSAQTEISQSHEISSVDAIIEIDRSLTPSSDRSAAPLPPPSAPPAPPFPAPESHNLNASAPLLTTAQSSNRPPLHSSSSASSLNIPLASPTANTSRTTSSATELSTPQRPVSTPPLTTLSSSNNPAQQSLPLASQRLSVTGEVHSARGLPTLQRRLSDTSASSGSLKHSKSQTTLAPSRSFSQRQPANNSATSDLLTLLPPTNSSITLEALNLPFTQASPMSTTDERLTAPNTGANSNNSSVPVSPSNSSIPVLSSSDVYRSLSDDEYFLGMVAMRDQPKTEVRSLVEHLMAAGIRFVFFSPENERKTQAFGGKIGLFTDFNVSISLKDPINENGEKGKSKPPSQGKSQLPCGVSAIRSHLESVDNVPLLVSLFTDCEPKDVSEMIRIYQENGECVMCMGSSLKVENTESFTQSDISASLDPIPSRECKDKTYPAADYRQKGQKTLNRKNSFSASVGGRQENLSDVNNNGLNDLLVDDSFDADYSDSREFAVSSAITSMPCALPLSLTTDLMQFIALICEGRRLAANVNSVLFFGLSLYCQLFIILFLTFLINSPPLFHGYQLIWLITIIIPLLSLSLFVTPRDPDVMVRLADKNIEILNFNEFLRHFLFWSARFLPSALIYTLMTLWFIHASTNNEEIFKTFYWQGKYGGGDLLNNSTFYRQLLAVQVYSECILVLVWIFHSISFVYRFESIKKLNPFINRWWINSCIFSLILQIIFAVITVVSVDRPAVNFDDWYWYIFFAWPPLLIIVDELIKTRERRKREFAQHRARSHFDTVLGMHSPK